MQGQVLAGRYEIGEELGTGGMGTVYAGRDLRTLGKVAIKIPHPWLARDPEYAARLRREAEISASVQSQRIVRIIDFDWHEGRPFLVMEYLPGPTLADRLEQERRLPWPEAAAIALEVARALEAAHEQKIAHRDLSPKNIKLVDGRVKVLDFGIARADGLSNLTATGVVLGSPDYCAPERLGGLHGDPGGAAFSRGDARSDIYSLGAIMYEMLTGHPPFMGDTHWAVIRGHISDPPPPLPSDVPAEMQAIVFQCLEKQPEARYQTSVALIAALRGLIMPELEAGSGAGMMMSETLTDLDTASAYVRTTGRMPLTPGPSIGSGTTIPARATTLTPPPVAAPLAGGIPPAAAPAAGSSPPVVAAPEKKRTLPLLIGGGAALLVVVAVIAAIMLTGRKDGTKEVKANTTPGADATATVAPSPSPTVTPAPTAAPALIRDPNIFTAADLVSGHPSPELRAGEEGFVCYGYGGAGKETSLTLVLLREDGSSVPGGESAPYQPDKADDLHCSAVPGAVALSPGRYVASLRDRGEERARVAFTLAAPTPSPTPSPEPTPEPTVVPVVSTPVRTPAPVVRTPVPSTPAPVRTAAPQTPAPTPEPPTPAPTQPPTPVRTSTPRATLVPGQ